MAEAIIGPLVWRLQELAVGQARALVAVNGDIVRLRDRLMWLQAFLREADAKRRAVSDEVTRVWLLQTRDAVFDAEDALDHFYLRVDMSRFPRWAQPCMRNIVTFTTQIRMRHILSGKIVAINTRLEEIIQNKDRYKMDDMNKEIEVTWKASTSISESQSELGDSQKGYLTLYAELQNKLEKYLTPTDQERKKNNNRPIVISVSGKSGVGKTTLVRNVYKTMVKKNCFDVHAMESFAPHLTAPNILHQIVQQLTEDNKNCPRTKVQEMLADALKGKNYLLVIDGEVSRTEWKNMVTILTTLTPGSTGNRIVHIRFDKPEQQSIYYQECIQLDPLENNNIMALFHERLRSQDQQGDSRYPIILKLKRLLQLDEQYRKLEEYREDICKITEGLPLAVVLLSGLVQTKEFPHEWTEVFKYLISKKSKRLDNLLSLCFDDLPHELKCCYLYFAAFPPNVVLEARNLVCMWMAEGFLTPRVGKTLEKVGYIFLNELIARNLVNPVLADDDNSSTGAMFVSIQNKIHEFLQSEAHEASFLEVHSGDDIPTLTSARRLSLQNYTDKYAALANPLPKLRSIFSQFEQEPKEQDLEVNQTKQCCCTPQQWVTTYKKQKDIKSHIKGLLKGSEFLRVIDLQGIEIGEELPHAIGSVVHLQYLGITSCSLTVIPPSIGSLSGLQTLDVRETNVRKLPLDFWMIKTLRHVFGFTLKLPKQIGSKKHMQTLDSIELDDHEQDLTGTVGNMVHLENLFVWNIAMGNMAALSIALKMLENLRTLALHGQIIPSSVFNTISLRRLKFMKLQGKLKPKSMITSMDVCLPNLSMLLLEKTKVSQLFITKLAELPSLETLALYPGSYKDEHLLFSPSGFVNLKKIKLDVPTTLKTIEIQHGALPVLKELDILSQHHQAKIIAESRITNIIV
ncbi:putative disease resistance RPP13-like protein 2 [Oryza brachyantha]|uniref:NB-ARC domain-containing protein n=1 Tax=Oryza brachyantha TaxID=4533 RepID=J3LP90_ORYBR|nr:putative disease resistance RPP13-like protein 2 [Oryza brachyantha]